MRLAINLLLFVFYTIFMINGSQAQIANLDFRDLVPPQIKIMKFLNQRLQGDNRVKGCAVTTIISRDENVISAKLLHIYPGDTPQYVACYIGDPSRVGVLFQKMVGKMNSEVPPNLREEIVSAAEVADPFENRPALKIVAKNSIGQKYVWFENMAMCRPSMECQ